MKAVFFLTLGFVLAVYLMGGNSAQPERPESFQGEVERTVEHTVDRTTEELDADLEHFHACLKQHAEVKGFSDCIKKQ